MKKTVKFLSFLFAIVMLVSSMPINALAAKVKAPAKPAALSIVTTTNTATLKWKKASGANGYVIYQYSKKKYVKKGTTSKTSFKLTKLKAATTYVYCVKAYKTVKKKKYYSAYSAKVTTSTLPAKATGVKAEKQGSSSAKVTWSKVTGATSYTVQYTDSAWSSASKVTSKANYVIINSLKPNTNYSFRVYAIRTVNKKNYTSAVSAVTSIKTDNKTSIDLTKTHQTITGFGASGAWWAQKVGGWENADDFIKLLYSKDEGIGLNIYRYNLGAGTDTDDKVDRGKSAETFIDSIDGTQASNSVWSDYTINYDWTKDANAQKALEIANKYADDLRVVLFANSPPKQITVNGKGYCSYHEDGYWENDVFFKKDSYNTNLARGNYDIYAKYLTDCADHFIDEGYNVVDVSPINEPQYAWSCDAGGYMSQEGCYYTPADMKALVAKLAIAGADKPYKFSMFESCGVSGTLWNPDLMFEDCFKTYFEPLQTDKTIKRYYDTVTLHSYWNNKSDKAAFKEYMNKNYPDYKIACTEYCQMTNDGNTGVWDYQQTLSGFDFNGMGMEHGVHLARTVLEDLTVLDATEWNWWTAVSGGYYPDGLVYYDAPVVGDAVWDSTAKEVFTSKRLWCLGNFSKFIREGAVRVDCDDNDSSLISCAFVNKDGSLVVVYVNTTDTDCETYIDSLGYSHADYYLTSECCDLENTISTDSIQNQLFTVPAKSVVSVIMTN